MKYFLDTEFHEDGKTIDLISLAIVAENKQLYVVNSECDFDRIATLDSCAWLRNNVMPYIDIASGITRAEIRQKVLDFTKADQNIEFYGYYADYDWVVFCQLFGRMIDLPKDYPMYCRDIKQMCADVGNPKLPKQIDTEHHALADAKWIKAMYELLTKGDTGPQRNFFLLEEEGQHW